MAMLQLLTLSRAARLAGVTRGAIQLKVRAGELQTFEGKVKMGDLIRVYPHVEMDASPILERVEEIKAQARPRRHQEEHSLPTAEVLVQRLEMLANVLVELKADLYRSTELLGATARRLDVLAEGGGGDLWPQVQELSAWLAGEMAKEPAKTDARARLFAKDTFLRVLAASVKVIPSGHEFFVEGTDSILAAAVRAGLALNYGCTSGNCGSCKARVVSGQVWKLRDHDYVLSEREKALGYMLMCSNTAITDLVVEAAEASAASDLPLQQIRATTHRIDRIGGDIAVLHVQTPRTQTLRFLAGQRATVTIDEDTSATLPIASCPCDGRHLEFHVRRRPGDRFGDLVLDVLRPSEMVTVTGPQGEFVLAEDSAKPSLFIAFDDGFAPIKSLVQHAISIDTVESFHLYWFVTGKERLYLDNLCRSWRDALENFRYTARVLGAGTEPTDAAERVLAEVVEDTEGLGGHEVYVAGPAPLVEAATGFLLAHGLPSAQLRTEVTATES